MRALNLTYRGGVALLAASLLMGCSSDPYTVGKGMSPDKRLAAFSTDAGDWAKLGYRRDWTGVPAITGNLPIQFIAPKADVVVVLEAGSQVSVLEASTGASRTVAELANPLTRFVGLEVDGDRVFAISEAEVFTVDAQTGVLRDRKRIEKVVATEPAVFGGLMIFGTPAGEVMAHMALGSIGGVKVWGFGMSGPVSHKPVLLGSTVGAVAQSGQVVFLNAETGGLIGRNSMFGGVETDPVADNNIMFVASLDQSLYAFSPFDGSMLWRYRTAHPLRTQPTAFGGRVYCSIPGEGLVAFEGSSGSVLWRCKDFSDGVVVAINRNRLLAFNGSEAALIDPERGDLLERAKLPGVAMLKPDSFVDGNLYAVSRSGVVVKFLRR